ncbi:hypothetical protein GPALN_003757 [Globodera pallida]|nr:hypothetical protein GPALN_003757 [Globodera pallida]
MFGAFFLLSLSSFFPNIFGALFTERHNKRFQQKEPFKITTPDDEEEVNWTVGPAQMCANSAYYHKCNNHLDSNLHCQCAPTDSDVRVRQLVFFSPLPSCSAALPQVELPNEQLLTFGIAFPVMGQFLKDPEGVFLEDLELYTFIPKVKKEQFGPLRMTFDFPKGVCSYLPQRLFRGWEGVRVPDRHHFLKMHPIPRSSNRAASAEVAQPANVPRKSQFYDGQRVEGRLCS